MPEFDVLPVRIHTEWHVHELSWWLRIESGSSMTGFIDEIIVRDDDLKVAAPALGTLEFSDNDYLLWRYIPAPNVVDAHMSSWVGVHGKPKAMYFNYVLKSLRRCCRYAVLSCGAVRSGFDVKFVDTALSTILNEEIAIRLKNFVLAVPEVLLIDVFDLLTLILCCVIEAENRLLFEDVFTVLTKQFSFEWLDERRELLEILLAECPKMSEWMPYLNSADCCKVADRLDGADFKMLQQVLANSPLQNARKRRL